MAIKTLILIDGENLLVRYEAMLKKGSKPNGVVVHRPGEFVWSPTITRHAHMEVIRVSYYTTYVCDDKQFEDLKNEIASENYDFRTTDSDGVGAIVPHVYKKQARGTTTKSVDINICIDALRHTYNKTIDKLILVSGDGDYVPLIQEVMRQGVRVTVGALSNGCHPPLKNVPDDFIDYDKIFFT